MKGKRKRKQKPLFYISQPEIKTPIPNMQESYLYKNGELDDQFLEGEFNQTIDEKKIPDAIGENDESSYTEVQHPGEQVAVESDTIPVSKKRSFNELTLEEKLKHLKLVPASIAKVRYEFITIEKSYKGYFLAIKNGTVLIHSVSTRKKAISILEEDLVDIKRIGL